MSLDRSVLVSTLAAVGLAFRHHQAGADQPLDPAEVEALRQLPGLTGQRLPDRFRAVQQVHPERAEPDPDHVAVRPGPLQQREGVAAELSACPGSRRPPGSTGTSRLPASVLWAIARPPAPACCFRIQTEWRCYARRL
jgi:hypothetical protein